MLKKRRQGVGKEGGRKGRRDEGEVEINESSQFQTKKLILPVLSVPRRSL